MKENQDPQIFIKLKWIEYFLSGIYRDEQKGRCWYCCQLILVIFYTATNPRKFGFDSQKGFCCWIYCTEGTVCFPQRKWVQIGNKFSSHNLSEGFGNVHPNQNWPLDYIYSISFRSSNRPFRWLTMWKVRVDYLLNLFLISIFFIRYYSNRNPSIYPSAFLAWMFIDVRM